MATPVWVLDLQVHIPAETAEAALDVLHAAFQDGPVVITQDQKRLEILWVNLPEDPPTFQPYSLDDNGEVFA